MAASGRQMDQYENEAASSFVIVGREVVSKLSRAGYQEISVFLPSTLDHLRSFRQPRDGNMLAGIVLLWAATPSASTHSTKRRISLLESRAHVNGITSKLAKRATGARNRASLHCLVSLFQSLQNYPLARTILFSLRSYLSVCVRVSRHPKQVDLQQGPTSITIGTLHLQDLKTLTLSHTQAPVTQANRRNLLLCYSSTWIEAFNSSALDCNLHITDRFPSAPISFTMSNGERVPVGFWFCCNCHTPNSTTYNPKICPSCGHERDPCCLEAGALKPIPKNSSYSGFIFDGPSRVDPFDPFPHITQHQYSPRQYDQPASPDDALAGPADAPAGSIPSGSWICYCGAANSSLTPDFCPLCGRPPGATS
ncbi:hypothetical protein K505DRAFT_421785 [Melanomma pulvis-pyrius CBS 109.77]|uniref:RanBP2-type domain-containing protein n=1 Tax=Melanomma pulvis-pyrius CBS 109.77 TaxID=1314802 RepID=A0A6A6WU10_9PLEO|nr:hypothetical protein K505DRAFT_421785 [Melanomma pulvis-pyrius CBS 109.77]